VPGKIGTFPWTLSRNRQTITEELYLDLFDGEITNGKEARSELKNISGTVRCEAQTTRGYFELGELSTYT